MPRVKFYREGRWARANPRMPQFFVKKDEEVDLDETTARNVVDADPPRGEIVPGDEVEADPDPKPATNVPKDEQISEAEKTARKQLADHFGIETPTIDQVERQIKKSKCQIKRDAKAAREANEEREIEAARVAAEAEAAVTKNADDNDDGDLLG